MSIYNPDSGKLSLMETQRIDTEAETAPSLKFPPGEAMCSEISAIRRRKEY
jgi:hypothetical protein